MLNGYSKRKSVNMLKFIICINCNINKVNVIIYYVHFRKPVSQPSKVEYIPNSLQCEYCSGLLETILVQFPSPVLSFPFFRHHKYDIKRHSFSDILPQQSVLKCIGQILLYLIHCQSG